jgi:hypothetical protein
VDGWMHVHMPTAWCLCKLFFFSYRLKFGWKFNLTITLLTLWHQNFLLNFSTSCI